MRPNERNAAKITSICWTCTKANALLCAYFNPDLPLEDRKIWKSAKEYTHEDYLLPLFLVTECDHHELRTFAEDSDKNIVLEPLRPCPSSAMVICPICNAMVLHRGDRKAPNYCTDPECRKAWTALRREETRQDWKNKKKEEKEANEHQTT